MKDRCCYPFAVLIDDKCVSGFHHSEHVFRFARHDIEQFSVDDYDLLTWDCPGEVRKSFAVFLDQHTQ